MSALLCYEISLQEDNTYSVSFRNAYQTDDYKYLQLQGLVHCPYQLGKMYSFELSKDEI